MTSKWDKYLAEEPKQDSKWNKFIVEEETTEKEAERVVGIGKEETPAAALIKKRPSELIRRPVAGLLDLLQSISSPAISPSQLLRPSPAPAEAARGDISELTPEEQEAGERLELLTQIGIPLPLPKGAAAVKKAEEIVPKIAKEVSKLKLPKIAEEGRKVSKLLKPTALPRTIEKTERQLLQQGEKVLQDIKKAKIPIASQIEAGKDIENITNKMFKKISTDSEKIPGKINPKKMISTIQSKIDKYTKARTPAASEKKAIDAGESLVKDLQKGDLSMKELIAQYRANNKASKSLIEKTLTEGSQPESLEMYQAFNESIAKEIDKHPEATQLFKKLFKTSNSNFAQLKKIDQYDAIIKSAVDEEGIFNPKKLSKSLQNSKKVRRLNKIIGAEGVNDLRKMTSDLTRAQEELSKIKPLKLEDLALGTPLLLKYLGIPGGKLITGTVGAKKVLDTAYGYYLMRPESRKILSQFTNALKSKNYDKARKAALKLEIGFKKTKKED